MTSCQHASGGATVLVGVGSNLGDSAAAVDTAFERLAGMAPGGALRSSLWRTKPIHCPPGSPSFINAVIAFEAWPELSPLDLLQRLQALEREFGERAAGISNVPRFLDLDLLTYGNIQHQSEDLSLPHPRALQRRFVLQPAAEIVPDLIWPGLGLPIRELAARLPAEEDWGEPVSGPKQAAQRISR